MKNDCNIVRDLLPLYYEDICSDESKRFIDSHMKSCEECAEYAEKIRENPFVIQKENREEKKMIQSFKRIKRKLLKKNILITLVSVLVLFGLYLFVRVYEIPITYDDNLFTVEENENGKIDIVFENDDYYCAYGMSREMNIDGAPNIKYVYFTDTIWTKFTQTKPEETLRFSIVQSTVTGDDEGIVTDDSIMQIDYIYYLVGDFQKITELSDEEYLSLAEEGILIWSKDENGE